MTKEGEKENLTGSSTAISVYLGSNQEGIENKKLIKEFAAKRGMKLGEFILSCVLDRIKHEQQTAGKKAEKPDR